ncbi:MAG: hypothetical protein EXS14_00675 [Planctomycetes bacterium]|nr:hypothetical protein [Planctomycetota bacterium]
MDVRAEFAFEDATTQLLNSELATLHSGAALEVRFPGLPRRVGRQPLDQGILRLSHGIMQRGVWRVCDAVALCVLQTAGGAERALALYEHADRDERLMATRALLHLATADALRTFLGMLQTTNDQALFEAAFLDGEHTAHLLDDAAWNRFLLKAAFIGLPLARIPHWEQRATCTLSRMLLDLQAEREAAGRPVWPDTQRVVACAPCVDR